MTASTLDAVRALAGRYPADLLPEGGTGLALFAAAYMGANDAIHFADKHMVCTCVDTDAAKLDVMSFLYPDDWQFFPADAWEYAAESAELCDAWDVVSVDAFTGDASARSLESLDLWCSLADRLVTVTVGRGQRPESVPEGWEASIFPRSVRASWLVLQHA